MSINRRNFLGLIAGLSSTMLVSRGLSADVETSSTRQIPGSGERIPVIGLGSWLTFAIDVENEDMMSQRYSVLKAFLDNGAGMLDSSPMYGVAQYVIGQSLQRYGVQKASDKGLFAATKVWTKGHRQGFLQMEDSRELWTLSGFDLMQVHNLVDWKTHLPTLRSMKDKGQLRYMGVTTSHGRRHAELLNIMKTEQLDFVQFTYNMIDREAEQYLLPLAAEKGIAVIINRPFQRGGLFDRVKQHSLPSWAIDVGITSWAQYFLKFIISHPAVTCTIPATTRVDHLLENMAVAREPMPDPLMRKKMIHYIESL